VYQIGDQTKNENVVAKRGRGVGKLHLRKQ